MQTQQSSFTYLPQSSNSIPNSVPSFPQPPTLPPQPSIFPPGTDPVSHTAQFTFTHVEISSQAQFHYDPNAASHNWITTPTFPITYDPTSSSAVTLNSLSDNNNWMNQSLVNNVIGSTPDQSQLFLPVRCEVCNIQCNTKDVYVKHLMGKKHRRNFQEKTNPSTAVFPETSNITNSVSIVANVQELERKKQKLLNAGTAVDSVRMCTICNVACNSYDAFAKHLSGRRHAAQAGLIAIDGIGPYIAATRANDHFWKKGQKTPKISQSTWCEVCKINCTSYDVYAKHVAGKKHLQSLENLEKSKNGTYITSSIATPSATNMITGAVENSATNSSSGGNVQKVSKEDLAAKRRKVLESGAAATGIRVCTICNVVCNSQNVYQFHVAGQKHAAMVKKQADAGKQTVTPQSR